MRRTYIEIASDPDFWLRFYGTAYLFKRELEELGVVNKMSKNNKEEESKCQT